MDNKTTSSKNFSANTNEKPIEEQQKEIMEKIMDLAKDPTKNVAELAQLAVQYADLEKLDTEQKAEEQKNIQAEQAQDHKEEMTKTTQQANQEKTMKMEDLKNMLNDTPENTEKNTETIVKQHKTRLKQTIDKYANKIQEIQKANDADKQKLQNELADIQKQLKAEKESYQQARNNFFADISKNFQNFSEKDLKKLPIRLIRYKQKEGLLNKPEGFNSISAIRRRKTIDTLIKKINLIDKDHTKGMNFVLWFHKERFGRYTDIKLNTAVRNIGKNIWLQMNPQQFHEAFNKWRTAINEVLENKNAGLLSPDEEQKVTAIKNRINYYGAAYAQERANARVNPFIQAEKNASNDTKIFQKPTNIAA